MLKITSRWLLALALLSASLVVSAQEEGNGDKKEEEKPKTIAELTEDAEVIEGLFTLFRDPKSGELHMLIKADQVGEEFIYFAQTANGVVEAGYFTGAYLANGIISVNRFFDRIELVSENFSFYFNQDNALSRAADANISNAVLAVQDIVAEDEETGDILIKADPIFLGENLLQIKFPLPEGADAATRFTLGTLADDKTKILETRNYPLNTDLEVEYVYNNPMPKARGSADITDARNVSIKVLHSLIAMPENDFEPRFADARAGSFDTQVTDLTSLSPTPFRDMVHRWDLVKQNPDAAMSDPVEPITWWIENTTPVEWRDLVRDSALEWNKAFEAAGFTNAVEVKVQPDDADWDFGDIRYNVLRWTSSPQPPFGGYGPSFVNPRTGQIIGADIMLEASFMNRHAAAKWLLDDGYNAIDHNPNLPLHSCTLGHGLKENALLARTFNQFSPGWGQFGDDVDQQILHDTMHYLILHEIGHTLGMNHNMKATQLLSPTEAFDMSVVEERGLAGSVMDYPAVNYPPRGEDITLFYAVEPGYYDDWYIQFAYDPTLDDPALMAAHLAKSTEAELAFGNDADDMRSPGAGMDPRVNIYDMSSDAIEYASMRMSLLQDTLDDMSPDAIADGQSFQQIWDGVGMMLGEWSRSAAVTSRYIGGVYVDRAVAGQPGANAPLTAVPADRQQAAMEVLTEQVFAPDVFQMSEELLRHTAEQRRGFNHFGDTQDPKVHQALLAMHQATLNHLLNPVVMSRIVDSGLYGNSYDLASMMTDLNDAVFEADAKGNVNDMRQNLQTEYVKRLAALARGNGEANGYPTQAVSMAVYSLGEIRDMINDKGRANTATKAHVRNLKLIIDRALAVDA